MMVVVGLLLLIMKVMSAYSTISGGDGGGRGGEEHLDNHGFENRPIHYLLAIPDSANSLLVCIESHPSRMYRSILGRLSPDRADLGPKIRSARGGEQTWRRFSPFAGAADLSCLTEFSLSL